MILELIQDSKLILITIVLLMSIAGLGLNCRSSAYGVATNKTTHLITTHGSLRINAPSVGNSSDGQYNITMLPYSSHYIAGLLNETAQIRDGMNVLRDVKPTDLDFKHWGGKQSSLTIKKIYETRAIPYFFRIAGSNGRDAGGFTVNGLNYPGKYVSLIIGNVTKSSDKDFQVSFVFTIMGDHGNYYLHLVHGPLYLKGWVGNNYYEGVNSYSSRLIDIHHLITDDDLSLRQIGIVVQNESKLAALDFRIDLSRTTENAPVILPGGGLYFVMGNAVKRYTTTIKYSGNIIHNLGITRVVDLDLSPITPDSTIIANGWNISWIYRWIDHNKDLSHISISAQQPLSLNELSPAVFAHLDIFQSVARLGSKDVLFLVAVLVPVLLYQLRGRNF
jgi:hypothetical protein